MMNLKEYSSTGKDLIEFGIILVITWFLIYVGLVISPYSGKLSVTLPFLAFGVLCILAGLALKKKPKKITRKYISGLEELGLAVLFFELLPALFLLFLVISKVSYKVGFAAVSTLLIPILLSLLTFFVYWEKAIGSRWKFIKLAKWLLLLSILSHLSWVNLLKIV